MTAAPSFDLIPEDRLTDNSLPAFMVSRSRGFLPREDPLSELPSDFEPLESLLNRMPIKKHDGSPGLLASFEFGEAVDKELPDLSPLIEQHRHDKLLMNALYRDYSFLASAYLLEPCHERHLRGEGYGLGRQVLPRNISLPMVKVAEIAGFKPWMEYAGSYALYNYRLADPKQGLEYDNLRLIRAFEHGLDPKSSEAGFVQVHIDMVKSSPGLVCGAVDSLDACARKDRAALNKSLRDVVTAMTEINEVMEGMWNKCKPGDYASFRTFIFGITSQSMFPNGVIYEGLSNEPMSFRGESGANDSMIPLCDNLLQVSMQQTPLTDILQDFRQYRPGNHREFLEWVHCRAQDVHLRAFTLEDAGSAALYLHALNQVRDFRWRHWCFTREFILKKSAHPTATGGSPIVTWLPNQLQAVLDQMAGVWEKFGGALTKCDAIMEIVESQRQSLNKEVAKYCLERKVEAAQQTAMEAETVDSARQIRVQ